MDQSLGSKSAADMFALPSFSCDSCCTAKKISKKTLLPYPSHAPKSSSCFCHSDTPLALSEFAIAPQTRRRCDSSCSSRIVLQDVQVVPTSESGWTMYLESGSDLNVPASLCWNRFVDDPSTSSDASSAPSPHSPHHMLQLNDNKNIASDSAGASRKRKRYLQYEEQTYETSSGSSSGALPQRHNNAIEDQLSILQNMIPNAHQLSKADVLELAIQYVKSLQHKIQIFEGSVKTYGVYQVIRSKDSLVEL